MARLPIPGSDDGQWGVLLNDFLSIEHTDDGTLKIRTDGTLGSLVHTTGNEIIGGVKTFTSSPIVPTPTDDVDVANKEYVDTVASSGAPMADGSTPGLVQLAGDLGGTATSPTVPGLTGKVNSDTTIASDPSAPLVVHRRTYAVQSTDADIMQFWAGATPTLCGWINEWGGYRGQPFFNWDAAVRVIAHPTQSGNPIEYQNNARTTTLWGVNPQGYTVMSGVQMAPVLVLGSGDPVPANTPAGTVILRT